MISRTQIVKVNGVESVSSPVLSGIPHGCVIGPLLFLIYINDFPDSVKSSVLIFADDTKLFRSITSKAEALSLQSDLDAL